MKHGRKTLSVLLTLAMLLTLAPTLGGTAKADVVWTEVSTPSQIRGILSSGSYRLTADLTGENKLDYYTEITGPVTIDLNGHGLQSKGGDYKTVQISNGGSLTLMDGSAEPPKHRYTVRADGLAVVNDAAAGTEGENYFTFAGGYITGAERYGGVSVGAGGTFNMTGGTIIGNTSSSNCGGVMLYGVKVDGVFVSRSRFTMSGGAIIGNTVTEGAGGGVHVLGGIFDMSGTASIAGNTAGSKGGSVFVDDGAFNLSGAPVIKDNTSGGAASNVYLYNNKYINVTDTLTNTTPIGVTMQTPGVFTNSTDTGCNGMGCFTSDAADLYVGRNRSGQLLIGSALTISFDLHGHGTIPDLTMASGSVPDLPSPDADGWEFKGWYKDAGCSDDNAVNAANEVSGTTLTFHAKWAPYDYTLTYDSGGGAAIGPLSYTIEDAITLPAPEKDGWTFDGWKVTTAGGSWTLNDTFDAGAALSGKYGNATLTGQWTQNAQPQPKPEPKPEPAREPSEPFGQEFQSTLTFDGGKIVVSPTRAGTRDTVTLTVVPDAGKALKSLTVTHMGVGEVKLNDKGNGVYTFTMPGGNVKFDAKFGDAQSPQTPPAKPSAVLSPQKITVNGVEITVEAYNIDGTNYFKLRDLAALLKGTPAQFIVDYDASRNAVVMTKGAAYGGEAAAQFTDKSASTVPSPQTVELDGNAVSLTAYNIGGNNFFGLRELAAYLGYGVDYDEASNTAIIESK